MDREKESDELRERKEEATDDTTLAEIESEQKVPSDKSNSLTPAPDEGSGRASDSDRDQPI